MPDPNSQSPVNALNALKRFAIRRVCANPPRSSTCLAHRARACDFLSMVFRSALKLMSGTVLAQGVFLAATPILTRLYSPAEFGLFGVFWAIASLAAAIVTGRYEGAIPLPKGHDKAWALLSLSLTLAGVGSLAAWGVLAAIRALGFASLGSLFDLGAHAYWIAPGIFFVAAMNCTDFWLNRHKQFSRVAWHRFWGGTAMAVTQLILGYLQVSWGLVMGFVVGMGTTFALNAWRASSMRPADLPTLKEVAWEYRRFPAFLLIAQVFTSAASHVPTVFFGASFGAAMAGRYTLASRALTMLDLLGTAVGQVFYVSAAGEHAAGNNLHALLKRTVIGLLIIAVPVFGLVFLVSPWAFGFIFGADWREAGEYVRYLMPLYFFRFIAVPANAFFNIGDKQNWYLYRQILQFTLIAGALAIGHSLQSVECALLLYASVMSLFYALDLVFAFRMVRLKPASVV